LDYLKVNEWHNELTGTVFGEKITECNNAERHYGESVTMVRASLWPERH